MAKQWPVYLELNQWYRYKLFDRHVKKASVPDRTTSFGKKLSYSIMCEKCPLMNTVKVSCCTITTRKY